DPEYRRAAKDLRDLLSSIQRLKGYYAQRERSFAALFFIAGFAFDLVAVGRVDSWHVIVQQAIYLAVVTAILTRMFFSADDAPQPRYRTAILSFCLGTLLNLYTIFFFKSSSLLVSFAFMLVMVALLLANEFGPFRRLGLAVFLGAYLLRVIPPVPLSIPFIGVYHSVERSGEQYRLAHERPSWRIWHNGDQHFRAQEGDRVFVFFRVFSPTRFADEVRMAWYRKQDGWVLQDSIPIRITGGRAEGFRGYGFKTNYQPGAWKVQIETNDGREIGR